MLRPSAANPIVICLVLGGLIFQSCLAHSQSAAPLQPSSLAHPVSVVTRPENPFIEKRGSRQLINFDLLVQNRSPETFNLVAIQLTVFDHNEKLEIVRELNQNGKPPALDMIEPRLLQPGAVIDIFQPFDAFDSNIELGRIHLDLLFMKFGRTAPPIALSADEIVAVDVRPQNYHPAPFCLPLHGPLLVHDGHDYYSHHRRYGLADRFKADPSSAVSANLYAYDFVIADRSGKLYYGDPKNKTNWLTYGALIFAPADGVVLEAIGDIPENSFDEAGNVTFPQGVEEKDPIGLGNHVKLRHADGRVSWLLHMKPDSVVVKAGDHVRTGQQLGQVGFSGDALFPHLHYNVTVAPAYPSQGVPSYFHGFSRILGDRRVAESYAQVDTGDLLEGDIKSCN